MSFFDSEVVRAEMTEIGELQEDVYKNVFKFPTMDKEEKIKHVAKLARISVDEAKVDSLTKDLNSIFKFIEQLNELNTDKVEPLTSILNQSLRPRKDQISDGKIREKILKNSPKKNEEFFVVPKVVE